MRIVVIGGTGHIGTYLLPRLVQLGHDVLNVSRAGRPPYRETGIWSFVEQVTLDRAAEERKGTFGDAILHLDPDAVIDLICFTLESAQDLVRTLTGHVRHYLFCGSVWVHGPSVNVPTTEEEPRHPFGEYGIQKAAIESFLLAEARERAFPVAILHPGHIVGRGWAPLNPQGHFNPAVFERLARGEELILPNLGMETVHHVHADDVAQAFCRVLANWSAAEGESFHVVSPAALTLRGYAERMAQWFGKEARLSFKPWDSWKQGVSTDEAAATWDHIAHSPNCSIAKARRLIGFAPRYSSLEAVCESVEWLSDHGVIRV